MNVEIMEPDVLIEDDVDEAIKDLLNNQLILWNDDVNTFEHVIRCLVKIVGHNPQQAEQCALIVHNNGKCSIKNGTFDELKPLKDLLTDALLQVTIE